MLWGTCLLDGELFNGGVEQYFLNSLSVLCGRG
jgi:hypothetical protein